VPYIREWVKNLPNRPCEFAEPFAGGANVGLCILFEDLADRLTLIELDEEVAAVWETILNGNAGRFASVISSFQVSPDSVRRVLQKKPKDLFQKAFAALLRNRVQRGGIMAPGASLMKRGENGRGLGSRWYPKTLANRILAITEMNSRTRFLHGDGIVFIKENRSRKDIAFFIDPPYTVAGRRLYTHSEIDHEELFRIVAGVEGEFLMSYDNAEQVRRLADKFGLQVREVAMKSTHHAVKAELLIGRDLSWLA
jgi:DNA adenine methylase